MLFVCVQIYAIAVDVSHAHTPDAPSSETFEFGGGTMIGMGPNMNTHFTKSLIRLAVQKIFLISLKLWR